ncbi:NTP transferase domain-containing protein [Candidatus Gottesmanbacteria bacterium]|nr:NTP transferase domain-containing protein [Candidatus Gottesmanbacteria bacterium]
MIVGIVLAAGKGTRMKSAVANKVTVPFLQKPMIVYGVELMASVATRTIVVVGAFADSVKAVLGSREVIYAYQTKRLGTGHALRVGLQAMGNADLHPTDVLVGYGDHTMFYRPRTVKKLLACHRRVRGAVSMITTTHEDPDRLRWGRIIRGSHGEVIDCREQGDLTTVGEHEIREINAGFYCFSPAFLRRYARSIPKSSVTGEYYITSLVRMAVAKGKRVTALCVPFTHVGLGVNGESELAESEKLYLKAGL